MEPIRQHMNSIIVLLNNDRKAECLSHSTIFHPLDTNSNKTFVGMPDTNILKEVFRDNRIKALRHTFR